MSLILETPINPLSLGQVGYNLTREIFKRKINCAIFPIGNVDLSPFSTTPDYQAWLKEAIENRYSKIDKNTPSIRNWHIMGSEARFGGKKLLYTYHELDSATDTETKICSFQDRVCFPCNYNVDVFKISGVENAECIPLGLDPDFKPINIVNEEKVTHWFLGGKIEQRKGTAKIVQLWSNKYGGDPKHKLHLLVTNPFLKPEQHQAFFANLFRNGKPWNINILEYLKTNIEVNSLLNAIDIDLSGLSSAESWGLFAFNTTALGKWSVVLNATGHKTWATENNAILVKPSGKTPAYDGIFFHQGQPINQGNVFTFRDEDVFAAMEIAESKARVPNIHGLKLSQEFNYTKTFDKLLKALE